MQCVLELKGKNSVFTAHNSKATFIMEPYSLARLAQKGRGGGWRADRDRNTERNREKQRQRETKGGRPRYRDRVG